MHKTPKISIIVPVYNAQETLAACLDSLMRLDFPEADREIIVVDNASTDGSKELIRTYPVTYIYEARKGRGYARNAGLRQTRGEYIAFTDADCIVTKNWLSVLLEYIERDEHVAACGGAIRAYRTETMFEKYAYEHSFLCQQSSITGGRRGEDLPRFISANVLCRKSALDDVGCFDEDLVTSEDTEISWRLSLAGYEMRFVSDAIVYHQNIRTFWKFCKHHFEYGKAHGVLFHKYFEVYYKKKEVLVRTLALPLFGISTLLYIIRDVRYILVEMRMVSALCWIPLVLHTLCRRAGLLYTAWHMRDSEYRSQMMRTIPLRKRVDDTLTVRNNGTLWKLMGRTTWFLNSDCIRIVVFNTFRIYALNSVATEIWLSLLRTRDLQKTTHEIGADYDVSRKRIARDVEDFIMTMEQEGILTKEYARTV